MKMGALFIVTALNHPCRWRFSFKSVPFFEIYRPCIFFLKTGREHIHHSTQMADKQSEMLAGRMIMRAGAPPPSFRHCVKKK